MDHTDSLDRMISRANSMMRTLRMKDKALENSKKPPLCSPAVRCTGDFVFSKICPQDCIGDSGQLLLAKEKTHRYLVKHEYTDSAANEFVYTKLARAMGFKMPNAVLFRLSDGEKRRYFKTEYIHRLPQSHIARSHLSAIP